MTAYLAESAHSTPLAFNKDESKKFLSVVGKRNERNRDCCKELLFGVFFDGTSNNAESLAKAARPTEQLTLPGKL